MLIKPGMCVKYVYHTAFGDWYEYGVVISKKCRGRFAVVNCGYVGVIRLKRYVHPDVVHLRDVVSTEQIECINHMGIYTVSNIQYLLRFKVDEDRFYHYNILLQICLDRADLFKLFDKENLKQNCFWEEEYKFREEEFIEIITRCLKPKPRFSKIYIDGTINRDTN